MSNNELIHYGVLGMRWGVRRSPEVLAAKRARIADEKEVTKAHKKYIDTVTPKRKKEAYADYEQKRSKAASSRQKEKEVYKKKLAEAKENPVKKMSDAELRQVINRMQMEKQYSQLTKKETSAGQKFVTDILTNAAKQTASNYVSKYMTKGVDILINKVTNGG